MCPAHAYVRRAWPNRPFLDGECRHDCGCWDRLRPPAGLAILQAKLSEASSSLRKKAERDVVSDGGNRSAVGRIESNPGITKSTTVNSYTRRWSRGRGFRGSSYRRSPGRNCISKSRSRSKKPKSRYSKKRPRNKNLRPSCRNARSTNKTSKCSRSTSGLPQCLSQKCSRFRPNRSRLVPTKSTPGNGVPPEYHPGRRDNARPSSGRKSKRTRPVRGRTRQRTGRTRTGRGGKAPCPDNHNARSRNR